MPGVANGAIQCALWVRAFPMLNEDQLRKLRDSLSSTIDRDLEGVTGDPKIDGVSVQFVKECLKAAEEERALIQNRLDFLSSLQ